MAHAESVNAPVSAVDFLKRRLEDTNESIRRNTKSAEQYRLRMEEDFAHVTRLKKEAAALETAIKTLEAS